MGIPIFNLLITLHLIHKFISYKRALIRQGRLFGSFRKKNDHSKMLTAQLQKEISEYHLKKELTAIRPVHPLEKDLTKEEILYIERLALDKFNGGFLKTFENYTIDADELLELKHSFEFLNKIYLPINILIAAIFCCVGIFLWLEKPELYTFDWSLSFGLTYVAVFSSVRDYWNKKKI